VTTIPVSIVLYYVATSDKPNFVTRLVDRYKADKEAEGRRNALHTAVLEQAAKDRHLLTAGPRDTVGPDLRYPECAFLPLEGVNQPLLIVIAGH